MCIRDSISTWQSIYQLPKKHFDQYKVILGDEVHTFTAKSLKTIMQKTTDCPYKFGLTGTLDDAESHHLVLEGLFGSVKKVTREFLIIDLGDSAEAILPRNELIPGDVYKIGDRIRAVLQEEERENKGSQLCLSRKCPEMVTELFKLEVPEFSEHVI